MKAWRRSRRLGGYAALVLGVAGTAVSGAGTAQAGVIPTRPAVMVWGSGSNLTPAQLADSTGVAQVSAGGLHVLVRQSDGTVWVSGLTRVTQVSAGAGFSLAIHPALLVIHPA